MSIRCAICGVEFTDWHECLGPPSGTTAGRVPAWWERELKPAPAWAYRPLRPEEVSRVAEGAGDPLPRVSDSELAALRGAEGDDTDDDWEDLAAEVVQEADRG